MRLFLLLSLLILFGCSGKAPQSHQYIEKKPPKPPVAYGFAHVSNDSVALEAKDTLKEDVYYKILNDAILPAGKLNLKKKIKFTNLTSKWVIEYLKDTSLLRYFTKDELTILDSEATQRAIYIFDPKRMNNAVSISVSDEIKIFKNKPKEKAWKYFNETYGLYGLHYFSVPLLNKEKNKAIVISGGVGYFLGMTGSEEILILNLVGGKWQIIKKIEWSII